MDELERRWAALAGTSPEAARLGADLLRRWNEPHRHYHDATHLAAVLDAVDQLGRPVRPFDPVRLAAWFHDAVYDGEPGTDERASADLAGAELPALDVSGDVVEEVRRLVLLTASHDPEPGDVDGAVLCDADLAVLGGSPDQYAAYAAAVRQDYAHVPDDAFAAGRAAVLERLLAADPLFHTDTGRRRWQDTARHNMSTELTLLRAGQ
ncbi:putative metal-dependent HD superfamily phosphohydrolase [Haloactinopolyspora alba]|uniref:Putative metal-dependent HD superfamily phosphohydrolase n=1 Tax=Haloactinopolyspora alba TaxID=648780 RepID=A0A2P8DM14_9ACTN|nr:metal-dependent phosphohydrolase [Haloactinopolyspora alba]PSK98283.1 putative metal-dependent HD superfamily phosphohydrolase [Haloactinopolyspora alba]